MEQVDSRIHFSPSRNKALQLFKQKYQRKGALDGVFVSILILFGIIGVLTILYLQASKAAIQSDKKVVLTANRQMEKPNVKTVALVQEEEEESAAFVSIVGELKPRTDIAVIIDSYDPKAEYILDMGNGQKVKAEQKEMYINYPGPGIYYPIMEVQFKGETEKVPLQKVWIR